MNYFIIYYVFGSYNFLYVIWVTIGQDLWFLELQILKLGLLWKYPTFHSFLS